MLPLSTEEDWSVISSSSDIDDDRSTTSSRDYRNDPLNLEDIEPESLNSLTFNSSSAYSYSESPSIATLRLPLISSGSHGRKTEFSGKSKPTVSDTTKSDSEHGDSRISDVVSITSGEETPSRRSENGDDTENPAKSACYLFGICQFNNSFKQKSNQFYANYAKIKLQQLNDYVANTKKEDLELTVEGLEPLQPLPTLEPVESLLQAQLKAKVQKVLLYCINQIQSAMESNSDYLIYYLFCYVALLSGLAVSVSYLSQSTKPQGTWDAVTVFMDKYLYEEQKEVLYLFFAKKTKVNKLFKISNQVGNSVVSRSLQWYQKTSPMVNEAARNTWKNFRIISSRVWNQVQFWETLSLDYIEKAAPVCIEKVSWFGEKAVSIGIKNTKRWSVHALVAAQNIAETSANKLTDITNLTSKTFTNAALLSSNAFANTAQFSSRAFTNASEFSTKALTNAAQLTSNTFLKLSNTHIPKISSFNFPDLTFNLPKIATTFSKKSQDLIGYFSHGAQDLFRSAAPKSQKFLYNAVKGANSVVSSIGPTVQSIISSQYASKNCGSYPSCKY